MTNILKDIDEKIKITKKDIKKYLVIAIIQ